MNIRSVNAAYGAENFRITKKSEQLRAQTASAAGPVEKVDLSDASRNLKEIGDVVRDLPEVRIDIVEKIKEKIKNNQYPIDYASDKAAENLAKNFLGA